MWSTRERILLIIVISFQAMHLDEIKLFISFRLSFVGNSSYYSRSTDSQIENACVIPLVFIAQRCMYGTRIWSLQVYWRKVALQITDHLKWSQQARWSVQNHRQNDWSFNSLFRLPRKKTSKLCLLFCEGNPLVPDGRPSKMFSVAEAVTVSWCHHVIILVLTCIANWTV